MLSPEYAALKHQVPVLVGVNDEDVAVAVPADAAVNDTGEPTAAPPLAQPVALANGPHTKKLTVPVGLPPALLPVTVAASVFCAAKLIDELCGLELVVVDPWPTMKHSPVEPSLEAL